MTLYECLGIENDLTDKEIPLDEIIENINDEELQYKALCYFEDVSSITQRVFFNRNKHCLQVIEVELNRVDYIDKISELIQKAIRCKVLIVFIYEGRYVVSTNRMRQNWIYGENLEDELVAEFVFNEITIDDENFNDVIGNAKILNRGVRESDYICLRQLCDWIKFCNADYRIKVYNVLEKVREKQAYRIINDIVFVEKEAVCDMAKGLNHSYDVDGNESTMSITHEEVEEYKNYLAQGDWVIREKDVYNQDEINSEIPEEIAKRYILTSKVYKDCFGYAGIQNVPCAYPTMDGVIRKPEAGKENQPERHWIAKQNDLKIKTIFKLNNDIYVLEQLQEYNLDDLLWVTDKEKAELIKAMDEHGIRPRGIEVKKYSNITDYINKKFFKGCKCVDCGKYLEGKCMTWEEFLCPRCRDRRINIEKKKPFYISCSQLLIRNGAEQIFYMKWDVAIMPYVEWENYNLIDVCIVLKTGALLRCNFNQSISYNKERKIPSIKISTTCDYSNHGYLKKKQFIEDIKYIHFVYKDIKLKIFYLYIFRITGNYYKERNVTLNNYLDYLDYNAYCKKKICQLKWQGVLSRQDAMRLSELPPVRDERYKSKTSSYKTATD